MNTNFAVIGLTRLGIKPESTVLQADALTTRPSELPILCIGYSTSVAFSRQEDKNEEINLFLKPGRCVTVPDRM